MTAATPVPEAPGCGCSCREAAMARASISSSSMASKELREAAPALALTCDDRERTGVDRTVDRGMRGPTGPCPDHHDCDRLAGLRLMCESRPRLMNMHAWPSCALACVVGWAGTEGPCGSRMAAGGAASVADAGGAASAPCRTVSVSPLTRPRSATVPPVAVSCSKNIAGQGRQAAGRWRWGKVRPWRHGPGAYLQELWRKSR